MKKNKIQLILILLFAFCLFPIITHAQTKSTDVKIINEKKYYIHKVEKGQSLYAISKTYSVDINIILAENDEAIDGLKNGQELKIPFKSLAFNQNIPLDTVKYVYHKIQKNETIYSITKKYNIDEKKLISLNPNINNGLKEGEQIIINEKKKNNSTIIPNSSQSYTVQQGETLYSLSKKLNISSDDIVKWNPELKDGLKQGQILKTQPITRLSTNTIAEKTPIQISTDIVVEKPTIKDTSIFNKPKKTSYNIGLLLPFKLVESETLNIEDLLRTNASFPNTQNAALDFYFGFKKAVDSLITKDFDISISLFDIQENDSAKIETLCKSVEFKKLDIIFGPLYTGVFRQVSSKAKALHIPCVAPITQQSKILYNNNLVSKVNPSQYTLIESLADYCVDSLKQNSNILIVNATQKDQAYIKAFKKRYNEDLIAHGKSLKDSIIEVKGLSGVKSAYISNKKNVVVLLTNNPVYLQDFITQLAVFSANKDYALLGFESTSEIDNLDQGYLNDLNFHFAKANHIDYTAPQIIELTKQYQQVFFSDPSEYYFEGFDIATYYLSYLKSEGPSMFLNLSKFKYTGVACKFKFWHLDSSSGHENRGISIYKYSKFKLQKLGWN